MEVIGILIMKRRSGGERYKKNGALRVAGMVRKAVWPAAVRCRRQSPAGDGGSVGSVGCLWLNDGVNRFGGLGNAVGDIDQQIPEGGR